MASCSENSLPSIGQRVSRKARNQGSRGRDGHPLLMIRRPSQLLEVGLMLLFFRVKILVNNHVIM